jgi:hypothetical protein
MRLPIDTSRLKFLVVADAEPLRQFEEGKPRESWAPRTDTNGEVLWRVQLVALVRALEGLEGVGMLDGTQKRELGRLHDRPRPTTRVNGAARKPRSRVRA